MVILKKLDDLEIKDFNKICNQQKYSNNYEGTKMDEECSYCLNPPTGLPKKIKEPIVDEPSNNNFRDLLSHAEEIINLSQRNDNCDAKVLAINDELKVILDKLLTNQDCNPLSHAEEIINLSQRNDDCDAKVLAINDELKVILDKLLTDQDCKNCKINMQMKDKNTTQHTHLSDSNLADSSGLGSELSIPASILHMKSEDNENLGHYTRKYKETIEVLRLQNEDGTVREKKKKIIIKIDTRNPIKAKSLEESAKRYSHCSCSEFDSESEDSMKKFWNAKQKPCHHGIYNRCHNNDKTINNINYNTKSEPACCRSHSKEAKLRQCMSTHSVKNTANSDASTCCCSRDISENSTVLSCSSGKFWNAKQKPCHHGNYNRCHSKDKESKDIHCNTKLEPACCRSHSKEAKPRHCMSNHSVKNLAKSDASTCSFFREISELSYTVQSGSSDKLQNITLNGPPFLSSLYLNVCNLENNEFQDSTQIKNLYDNHDAHETSQIVSKANFEDIRICNFGLISEKTVNESHQASNTTIVGETAVNNVLTNALDMSCIFENKVNGMCKQYQNNVAHENAYLKLPKFAYIFSRVEKISDNNEFLNNSSKRLDALPTESYSYTSLYTNTSSWYKTIEIESVKKSACSHVINFPYVFSRCLSAEPVKKTTQIDAEPCCYSGDITFNFTFQDRNCNKLQSINVTQLPLTSSANVNLFGSPRNLFQETMDKNCYFVDKYGESQNMLQNHFQNTLRQLGTIKETASKSTWESLPMTTKENTLDKSNQALNKMNATIQAMGICASSDIVDTNYIFKDTIKKPKCNDAEITTCIQLPEIAYIFNNVNKISDVNNNAQDSSQTIEILLKGYSDNSTKFHNIFNSYKQMEIETLLKNACSHVDNFPYLFNNLKNKNEESFQDNLKLTDIKLIVKDDCKLTNCSNVVKNVSESSLSHVSKKIIKINNILESELFGKKYLTCVGNKAQDQKSDELSKQDSKNFKQVENYRKSSNAKCNSNHTYEKLPKIEEQNNLSHIFSKVKSSRSMNEFISPKHLRIIESECLLNNNQDKSVIHSDLLFTNSKEELTQRSSLSSFIFIDNSMKPLSITTKQSRGILVKLPSYESGSSCFEIELILRMGSECDKTISVENLSTASISLICIKSCCNMNTECTNEQNTVISNTFHKHDNVTQVVALNPAKEESMDQENILLIRQILDTVKNIYVPLGTSVISQETNKCSSKVDNLKSIFSNSTTSSYFSKTCVMKTHQVKRENEENKISYSAFSFESSLDYVSNKDKDTSFDNKGRSSIVGNITPVGEKRVLMDIQMASDSFLYNEDSIFSRKEKDPCAVILNTQSEISYMCADSTNMEPKNSSEILCRVSDILETPNHYFNLKQESSNSCCTHSHQFSKSVEEVCQPNGEFCCNICKERSNYTDIKAEYVNDPPPCFSNKEGSVQNSQSLDQD